MYANQLIAQLISFLNEFFYAIKYTVPRLNFPASITVCLRIWPESHYFDSEGLACFHLDVAAYDDCAVFIIAVD